MLETVYSDLFIFYTSLYFPSNLEGLPLKKVYNFVFELFPLIFPYPPSFNLFSVNSLNLAYFYLQ